MPTGFDLDILAGKVIRDATMDNDDILFINFEDGTSLSISIVDETTRRVPEGKLHILFYKLASEVNLR